MGSCVAGGRIEQTDIWFKKLRDRELSPGLPRDRRKY